MVTASSYLRERAAFFTPVAADLEAIRNRREAVYKRLNDRYIVNMFESGSMNHGTGIWLYSDVDYMVRFWDQRPTPDTALARLKTSMTALYPTTTIRVSRPAVKVKFSTTVHMELTPAYAVSGDGDDVFWIPDPTDSTSWMKSAPQRHLAYVNAAKRKHANAKEIIRLAKIWKASKNVPISSFYVEMRVAKMLTAREAPLSTIDGLESFFELLYENKLASLQDPTRFGGLIAATSTATYRQLAQLEATDSYQIMLRGRLADYQGDDAEAVRQLKRLFGD